MNWLFPAALALTGALGAVMALWGLWYLAGGALCWRKSEDYGWHPARTKFAVLIAARNEELVIGPLINSLLTQNYPPELYDIWVIPNNCTDNTALAARNFGARVLEFPGKAHSKGEVLQFAYHRLRGRRYDAYCVFDADNVVHRDFLMEMNHAYMAGARAAQGYRDSKNPYDTAISGCYSIYYWMMDRFHNAGRSALSLSAMIGGTGFMVSQQLLDKLGDWQAQTISEDLELTAQTLLAGERVRWVPKAITYDEQPNSWEQSFKQRRRWTSGTIQVARAYFPAVARKMVREPGLPLADLGATLLIPAYQISALASLAVGALAAAMGCLTLRGAILAALAAVGANLFSAALTATALAAIVITLEGKWDRRLLPALGAYWLFLLTWIPITAACFVKDTTVWEEIRHTRNVAPEAMAR